MTRSFGIVLEVYNQQIYCSLKNKARRLFDKLKHSLDQGLILNFLLRSAANSGKYATKTNSNFDLTLPLIKDVKLQVVKFVHSVLTGYFTPELALVKVSDWNLFRTSQIYFAICIRANPNSPDPIQKKFSISRSMQIGRKSIRLNPRLWIQMNPNQFFNPNMNPRLDLCGLGIQYKSSIPRIHSD